MLGGALGQIRAHRQRVARMRQWLSTHAIDALVPVDSPAANWAMCKLTRSLHPKAKIIHLAAPQIWAWARWRIRKLRRLTDHVLCLLPFEPKWFGDRGVPCSFVGHPLYQMTTPPAAPASPLASSQATTLLSAPRLALLPGQVDGGVGPHAPGRQHAHRGRHRAGGGRLAARTQPASTLSRLRSQSLTSDQQ